MAWLTGYGYRQKVPLKRVDGAVTDYQMLLTVNKGAGDSSGAVIYLKNHALSWGSTVPNDLRFTRADEVTELPYWIEFSDANTAKVWGKYNSIETTDTYFYVYYGKSGDTTTSNGDNTFIFFDDFPGSTLDIAKWDTSGGGSVSVSDGLCTIIGGDRLILSKTNIFNNNTAARARMQTNRWDTTAGMQQFGSQVTADWYNYVQMNYCHIYSSHRRHLDQAVAATETLLAAATGDWAANTYYINEVIRAATHTRWTVNDVLKVELGTTNYPTADGILYHRAYNSGDTMTVDWTLVRKWADQEPTWGTWGTEETPPRSFGYIIG